MVNRTRIPTMSRPLLFPLLCMITGLYLADSQGWFFPEVLPPLLFVCTFAVLFLRNRWPFITCLGILFLVWGNLSLRPFLNPSLSASDISRFITSEKIGVEGIIDTRPAEGERGTGIYLQVEKVYRGNLWAKAEGRLYLHVGSGEVPVSTGDRIRFLTPLRTPRLLSLPGEFDYGRYLAHRKVYTTAFVRTADEVVLMRSKIKYPLRRAVDEIAARTSAFMERAVPTREGDIVRALIIGDRGAVGKEIEELYARTGVNHILSISGFHVGVIASFLFFMLLTGAKTSERLLLGFNMRRVLLLVTLPVLLVYFFLTGAAPATARSVIMISVLVVALWLERESDPMNSLVTAAFLILALWPPALFDLSFQLSFLAFWGMIILVPAVMGIFRGLKSRWSRAGALLLAAGFAATAATFVPIAYHFHRTSIIGLVANFAVVPLMGYGAVILGFAALPFIFLWGEMATLLLRGAAFFVHLSDCAITWLAAMPELPSWTPSQPQLSLFFVLVAAVTFVASVRGRIAVAVVITAAFIAAGLWEQSAAKGKLVINFLSIGQGEATLITFPDGKRMLVDGGGNGWEGGSSVGERLLVPALRRLGADRLDFVVMTHAHPDHAEGLISAVKSFPVGEFWESGINEETTIYRELTALLKAGKIPVRRVHGGSTSIPVGGAVIEPMGPMVGTSPDGNENSLVFRLSYGTFSMLFTGDIGAVTEKALVAKGGSLHSTVLKVPHHGSRHSSSPPFLRAVSPEVALIATGYGNSHGLPTQEVLDRLGRVYAAVFRTDLDGTIVISVDEEGYDIIRWKERGLGGHSH